MNLPRTRCRPLLQNFDFRNLFIEELGWDTHKATLDIPLKTGTAHLESIAHKRGFVAWHCPSPAGEFPNSAARRKIEREVAKAAHEHLIVFTDAAKSRQIWQWVRRDPGQPLRVREIDWAKGQSGEIVLQKLDPLFVSLDDEETITLLDVTSRARANVSERVTKKFYEEFRKQHSSFLKFITGIPNQGDHEWYASVMLNRLMFVYFIQKKGFLDGDTDYLRNRLNTLKAQHKGDKFYSFYRAFLLRLFHEGLGGKKRKSEIEKLIGRVPYLNGGIFDVHQIERDYGDAIQIPDKAFEAIFDYFDRYHWHLDERPLRSDNEINPDVLGYIFEKYINQKQMGAYYTKEDITEYISKSTIIPFLFDATKAKCKVAFERSAGVPPANTPFLHPFENIEKHRHNLPHWQQGEAWQFVTWRLADSMPQHKLDEWEAEKHHWLASHPQPWDEATARLYHEKFSQRVDDWLDAGHGSCLLRNHNCATIVANALKHFDGQRYHLGPYVVMPNHVHVLFQPLAGHALEEIVHSWKSFSAKKINQLTGRTGSLWQADYWDRMIRHEAHWHACRQYIAQNPAKLPPGTYVLEERSSGVSPANLEKDGQDARSPVWDLLRENPDRYIYPAIRHGCHLPLPPEIAAGINPPTLHDPVPHGAKPDHLATLRLRKAWNQPAPPEFALPTEIWRETVARRQRYWEVWSRLSGRVAEPQWVATPPTAAERATSAFCLSHFAFEINDFITLNLDLRQFAQDVIHNSEGPDLIMALWQVLSTMTILDPTGGSGAFLFAALNILEPLYEGCLDRMAGFLTEWERSAGVPPASTNPSGQDARSPVRPPLKHPNYHKKFSEILAHVAAHPNRRYFVLKSIILNNLYAVDIMEEAVEICKLRLFLKLAAQVDPDPHKENLGIEPLPDIDFNIRCGNTLVGYATYDEVKRAVTSTLDFDNAMEKIAVKAADLQQTFDTFRKLQTEGDGTVPADHKKELQKRLKALEDELNRHLAGEYGIKVSDKTAYNNWLQSHQPFHWFIQFYGILNGGGFDVIIGNPPYVEYKDVCKSYQIRNVTTKDCCNLFAFVLERCTTLSRSGSAVGMIIPLSAFSTDRMIPLITHLKNHSSHLQISNFSWRPGKLFDGVHLQLSIVLQRVARELKKIETTRYLMWDSEARPELFSRVEYATTEDTRLPGSIPKLGSQVAASILTKLRRHKKEIGACFTRSSRNRVLYRRGGLYWKVFVDFETGSSEEKIIHVLPEVDKYGIIAVLSSGLWWWYFTITSDCRHLGNRDIFTFPFDQREMSLDALNSFCDLGRDYVKDLKLNAEKAVRIYKGTKAVECLSFRVNQSKPILDEIDTVLAAHYGFTEEELDFIINYDIKYRMGRNDDE